MCWARATAILLAYRHGLRASELVALRWDDVDFRTGKLHVRRSKGGQPSVHPIGGRELRALRRLQREGQPGRYVFTSERAPLVRLQAGQRWAGHPIDPTLSWPQVDCFRRFATRRSRRIGLRISGEIEKNAPADANGRPFAAASVSSVLYSSAQVCGQRPPGGPQNK